MLSKLFLALSSVSPYLKRSLWKRWYQFLAKNYPIQDWAFMNYGYAPLPDTPDALRLDEKDEPDRYSIQLYNHVVTGVHIENLNVLEVGCGRGGGASYIARYLRPKTLVGIDLSDQAIEFCRANHKLDGLIFQTGDAESLPFKAASFDVVINVESSSCYGAMATFLSQVKKVLRPGGYFLYADNRWKGEIDRLDDQLEQSGMTIRKREDITPNVVRSLSLDSDRKLALIHRFARHAWLIKPFSEFAAIKETWVYEYFRDRKLVYVNYILQK